MPVQELRQDIMCGDGDGPELSGRDRSIRLAEHIGRLISRVVELARCREVAHREMRLLHIMQLLKEILAKISILRKYQGRVFSADEFEAIIDAVICQLPL